MFKVILQKNSGLQSYDITPIITGGYSWDYDLSIKSDINFSIIVAPDMTRFFPKNPVEIGDVVLLYKDGTEIIRGVVTTEDINGRDVIQYKAMDYGWYLSQSKTIYQFNNIQADKAITKIMNDCGMLIDNIPTMRTTISSIYVQQTPAEIISNIIQLEEQQTGAHYSAEMRQGRIYIVPTNDTIITGSFVLADNVAPIDVMDNPLGISRSRSIEDMRNRINVIIIEDNGSYEITSSIQDANSISKYGLLEETVKIDVADISKSRQVANILLQRLNRISETITLDLMGDIDFKAGRLLQIDDYITGVNGTFLITGVKHTVNNQVHTMSVELSLPQDVKGGITGGSN